MNKKIIWGIILAVLVIGGGFWYYFLSKDNAFDCCHGEQYTTPGLTIEEPKPEQEVQLPITIKGYISGSGWSAFEANVGSVQVLDANGKALTERTPLQATTDWMQPKVYFEATVGDRQRMSYLETQTGILVFRNENPKGDSVDDKEFRLPIRFANNSTADWKTYEGGYFTIKYPRDWYAGVNYSYGDSLPVEFCPPTLVNNVPYAGAPCKTTADELNSLAPIYVLGRDLKLVDEKYRDIYSRMLSTFKFTK